MNLTIEQSVMAKTASERFKISIQEPHNGNWGLSLISDMEKPAAGICMLTFDGPTLKSVLAMIPQGIEKIRNSRAAQQ